MFAMGRLGKLGAVAHAVQGAFAPFSPASLFANGEQGIWYDVSDFSTLFQDAAGTIPVTAVEQPVGLILDKRSQFLGMGPELCSDSALNNPSAWVDADTGTGESVVSGGELSLSGSSGNFAYRYSQVNTVIGRSYLVEAECTGVSTGTIALGISSGVSSFLARSVSFSGAGKRSFVYVADTTISYVKAQTQAGSGSFTTISVRELPGNHASQANTLSRAWLRARYNLLTFAEDFSQSVWVKIVVAIAPGSNPPPRSNAVTRITANGDSSGIYQTATVSNGLAKAVFRLRRVNADWVRVQVTDLEANAYRAWVNLAAGTIGQTAALGGAIDGYSDIEPLGDGWYEVTVSAKLAAVTTAAASMVFASGDGVISGAFGLAVDCAGIDLRPANLPASPPPYQRIAAATDYDTAGFPVYLDPDGTDDSYQTGSINFTATDKVTIWAGLRKVDDNERMLCELSANWAANAGAFSLQTGPSNVSYFSVSRATAAAAANQGGRFNSGLYPAPDSAVITAQHDIAGDLSRIRRNGSSAGAIDGTGDKGAGNFGNYPLYLFSRGGISLRWKGQFYGLIIRGAATDTTPLEQTEQWLNAKMGGIY